MADLDDEKAAQHVHPDKPDRTGETSPAADPNENQPGEPQHETNTEFDGQQ
jgi:hypothetical protein